MSKRGAPGASGSFAQIQVLQAELERGFALHQQNRLAEAERIYRAILQLIVGQRILMPFIFSACLHINVAPTSKQLNF